MDFFKSFSDKNEDFFDLAGSNEDQDFEIIYGEQRLAQLKFVQEFRGALFPHEKVIFDLRLAEGKTIKAIAEEFKVSKPYVSTIAKNIIQKCNECYRLFVLKDPNWKSSLHKLPDSNYRASTTAKKLANGFKKND